MPIIQTKYFGAMPFKEDSCFEFPWGLPAFEEERRMVPIQVPDHKPLLFLQSSATPSLCFIALPVLVADPDYRLAVSPEDLEALELAAGRQPEIGSEVLVVVLLSIRDDAPATANLLAPVVVNLATRRALQAVRHDTAYSHEYLLPALKEESAC